MFKRSIWGQMNYKFEELFKNQGDALDKKKHSDNNRFTILEHSEVRGRTVVATEENKLTGGTWTNVGAKRSENNPTTQEKGTRGSTKSFPRTRQLILFSSVKLMMNSSGLLKRSLRMMS